MITPHLLSDAAMSVDKVAKEIWKIVGEKLRIFLSIIINFENPDTIVLYDGVSHAGKYFMGQMSEEIKKGVFKSTAKAYKIVNIKYTHKLGVVGAVMLPKQ